MTDLAAIDLERIVKKREEAIEAAILWRLARHLIAKERAIDSPLREVHDDTAAEALAQALDIDWSPEHAGWSELDKRSLAAAILAALPSGWVLARVQDAADGEALRRLREALPKAEYPDGWVIELEDDPEESVRRRLVCITVTDAEAAEQAFGSGDTIAEAADAARGVLEARDA